MKKFTVFILSIFMLVGLVGCSNNNQGQESDQEGTDTIRIGMEANYTPFNWTQSDDSNGAYPIESGGYAGGYDVEIAKRIADGLDKELIIVKSDWEGLSPALTSGVIDLIIAGMSPTEERKETINFSAPYYVSEYVMVVQKDGPYENAFSLEDFSGAKISAQLNTYNYDLVDQIPGVNKEQAMDSFSSLMVALDSGKIDGYVSEVPAAESALGANPNLTYVSFEEGQGFDFNEADASVAVGISKEDEELLEEVNKILETISEEERNQLMEDALANQPLNN